MRVLAEISDVIPRKYPNVLAWMERVERRASYNRSAQTITWFSGLCESTDKVKHVWQKDVCVSWVLTVDLGEES